MAVVKVAKEGSGSNLKCRLESIGFISKLLFKCIFTRKHLACIAQVMYFTPAKNKGDTVEARGDGIILGPEPALMQMMSNLNEHFVRTVVAKQISPGDLREVLSLMRGAAGGEEEKPVVH